MRIDSRHSKRKLFVVYALIASWILMLLCGSSVSPGPAPATKEVGEQTHKVIKGLIILVAFPDVSHTVKASFAERRFFWALNKYVEQMSYGKVSIGGEVTDRWYVLPHPVSHYRIPPRNLEVDPSRVGDLVRDVLDAVDSHVSFSEYDFVAFFMGVRGIDFGMGGLCAYPGFLGFRPSGVLETKSGQRVKGGIAVFSYQAHLGTLFHDVAHILAGVKDGRRMLPCLYDHDLQSRAGPDDPRALMKVFVESQVNMGSWDPMSCHFYKWRLPPPGISSWTKMRLGWIDQSKVKVVRPGETTKLVLGPLEDGSSETLAVKIPLSKTTYYLIENRQPIGFDQYLPGSGVLIIYADDKVAECRHGRAPARLINANPDIPYLEGAAFDLGKNESFIDKKKRIQVQLLGKIQYSQEILIAPYSR